MNLTVTTNPLTLDLTLVEPGGYPSADAAKLAAIEANATADQSGAEILAALEAETGRTVATDGAKLDGIEANATADQSASEIKTLLDSVIAAVSQAEAEAGTETEVRQWSPLRIAQAIAALAAGGGGGKLAGFKIFQETANHSTAATIAIDNSKPGASEGASAGSQAYTPAASGNTLLILIHTMVCSNMGAFPVLFLLKDSDTEARTTANTYIPGSDQCKTLMLLHEHTTTGTSEETWKARFGGNVGMTYLNRHASGLYYDSTMKTTWVFLEMAS